MELRYGEKWITGIFWWTGLPAIGGKTRACLEAARCFSKSVPAHERANGAQMDDEMENAKAHHRAAGLSAATSSGLSLLVTSLCDVGSSRLMNGLEAPEKTASLPVHFRA